MSIFSLQCMRIIDSPSSQFHTPFLATEYSSLHLSADQTDSKLPATHQWGFNVPVSPESIYLVVGTSSLRLHWNESCNTADYLFASRKHIWPVLDKKKRIRDFDAYGFRFSHHEWITFESTCFLPSGHWKVQPSCPVRRATIVVLIQQFRPRLAAAAGCLLSFRPCSHGDLLVALLSTKGLLSLICLKQNVCLGTHPPSGLRVGEELRSQSNLGRPSSLLTSSFRQWQMGTLEPLCM